MMRENAFSSTVVVVVGFGPISGAAIVTQGRGEGSGKQRSKFRKRQNLADEFIEDLGIILRILTPHTLLGAHRDLSREKLYHNFTTFAIPLNVLQSLIVFN